jgi:hypothetical protein
MAVGWVHQPSLAPHLHGCQPSKTVDLMVVGTHWVCPKCETLWILHDDYLRWWHWERATWWQRWKYWNWIHGREST